MEDERDVRDRLTELLENAMPLGEAELAAARLAHAYPSAAAVFESDAEQLAIAGGLNQSAAQLLTLIPALARRTAMDEVGPRPFLRTAADAFRLSKALYIGVGYEQFIFLSMDADLRLTRITPLQKGSLREAAFYPRQIMETALVTNAVYCLFLHNHPGGTRHFSESDLTATRMAIPFLGTVGVSLLDHILTAGGGCVSMRAKGYIAETTWQGEMRPFVKDEAWLSGLNR